MILKSLAVFVFSCLSSARAYGQFEAEHLTLGAGVLCNKWLGKLDITTDEESSGGSGFLLKGIYRINDRFDAGAELGCRPWYGYEYRFTIIDIFLQPREVTAEVSFYSQSLMGVVHYRLPEIAWRRWMPRLEGAFGFHRTVSIYREKINGVDFTMTSGGIYPAAGAGIGLDYEINETWRAEANLRATIVLTPGGASGLLTPGIGVTGRFF